MIDLPLVFLGGLLGSGHCVGMCGPLAMILGSAAGNPRANIRRQLAFTCGRIFTYAFFGATLGYFGTWIVAQAGPMAIVQASLGIVAGIALILVGVTMIGLVPHGRWTLLSSVPCSAVVAVKTLLATPTLPGAALAGVFTGFIPCGLVYAFLLKAVNSGGPLQGALSMALFGAGTAPLLVLTGFGGGALAASRRALLLRLAAWCVVATGFIAVARGAWQFAATTSPSPSCPFCAQTS